MKILIDARKLGDGGIGVYIENLIDGLIAYSAVHQKKVEISALVSPHQSRVVSANDDSAISSDYHACLRRWSGEVEMIVEPAAKYSFSEYLGLARRQSEVLKRVDLFHSPHYTLPYFLKIPSVVTIHDVIHITNPDSVFHRPIGRRLIRSAVKRASHVITVSNASKRALEHLIGLSPTPITVVPNAIRGGLERRSYVEVEDFLSSAKLERNYALFIGSERPHKGFSTLLQAWKSLRFKLSQVSHPLPKLIVVGNRFSEKTTKLIEELGLSHDVLFLGEPNVDELSLLYSGASLVVVPSRAEGFGLVALEGMYFGAPVVCSNIAVLKETCGENVWYAPDDDAEAFAQVFFSVLRMQVGKRERLEKARIWAKQFSLGRMIQSTLEVYRSISKDFDLDDSKKRVQNEERMAVG